MSKISTGDTEKLPGAVAQYLAQFLGDTICVRQIWYEGLGGSGVPGTAVMAAVHAVMDSLEDWQPAGSVRYEKYGLQYSFKRVK
jgi:hypothetical protein